MVEVQVGRINSLEDIHRRIVLKDTMDRHRLRFKIQEILNRHMMPLSKWASPKKVHDKVGASIDEIMELVE